MNQQNLPQANLSKLVSILLLLLISGILLFITWQFWNTAIDEPLILDSTVGELAIWMSDQSGEEEIVSFPGRIAADWADSRGEETLNPDVIVQFMKNALLTNLSLLLLVTLMIIVFIIIRPGSTRALMLFLLMGIDSLLFIVPVIDGNNIVMWILLAIMLMLAGLLIAPGKVTRVIGFFVVLSFLFVVWESSKAFANMLDYKILLPQASWEYSSYPTIEDALDALNNGEVDAIVLDRNDLSDLMPEYPDDPDAETTNLAYPDLRYLNDLDASASILFFEITPEFPGRLKFAVRVEDAANPTSIHDFYDVSLATVAGEFAEGRYLAEKRNLVLLDLKILNDVNLPHLQTIAEAFLQPARRNGSQLLIRILAEAGWYTWGEAAAGFVIGAILGLILGTFFAHSHLMERSLLPYVVASQTVPILAIAPMVVIWLGASQLSVAVIAAYLTFFPVTINTLRGLRAPSQSQLDLMQSYAADTWTILWKVRFPAALPYIFTALKVSATASVVGAIIGELPSGIGDGLGRAILDFSSDYSLISTPKLWASIIMAAMVGIFFFVAVSLIERLILGRYIRNL